MFLTFDHLKPYILVVCSYTKKGSLMFNTQFYDDRQKSSFLMILQSKKYCYIRRAFPFDSE